MVPGSVAQTTSFSSIVPLHRDNNPFVQWQSNHGQGPVSRVCASLCSFLGWPRPINGLILKDEDRKDVEQVSLLFSVANLSSRCVHSHLAVHLHLTDQITFNPLFRPNRGTFQISLIILSPLLRTGIIARSFGPCIPGPVTRAMLVKPSLQKVFATGWMHYLVTRQRSSS